VDEPLRSFHLEALAWSVFGTSWFWHESMRSDWVSARYFFDKARDKLRYKLSDPSGTGADVGGYVTGTSMEKAISKMTTAYERCVRAERLPRMATRLGCTRHTAACSGTPTCPDRRSRKVATHPKE